MNAKEVLRLIRTSRNTLHNYQKKGIIRGTRLGRSRYDYNADDVAKFMVKGEPRKTVVYMLNTGDLLDMNALEMQKRIETFAEENGYEIDFIYRDTGYSLNGMPVQLGKLLELVSHYKVETILIYEESQISKKQFEVFEFLISKFLTKIVIVNEE